MTFDKKLSTGRKVKIRQLSVDTCDELADIPEVIFFGDQQKTIKNINKAQTSWIREGLAGGDFDGWTPNGKCPPDSVLRQIKEVERPELVALIKECQSLNPSKPSNSD